MLPERCPGEPGGSALLLHGLAMREHRSQSNALLADVDGIGREREPLDNTSLGASGFISQKV